MSDKTAGDLIMERASLHYKNLGVRQIEVPEWECTIFYKPVTLAEQQACLREAAFGGGREFAYAKAIIDKSMDGDGRRLFNIGHQIFLVSGTYAGVVQRIGEAILAIDLVPPKPLEKGETEQEQAEGNS
jgi:hypothetical protein